MHTDYKKWLYLIVLSLIWGSSYILIKKGLIALSPIQLGSLRILFTFSILAIAGYKHLKTIPVNKWIWIGLSGFLGTFFPNYLFAYAETKIDSAIAAVLNGLTPLFTLLFGLFFFGIGLKRKKLLGVVVGLFGTVILVIKQVQNTGIENGLYLLLVVIAALCYAANVNIIKYRLQGISSLGIALGNFVVISIPTLAIFFASGFLELNFQTIAVQHSIGYIFILAVFVGVEIITKVPPTLHTPLMSGSNAISGIAVVGAIISTKIGGEIGTWLGFAAVIFATVNVVGGFMVTDRMLKMFKKK